LEASLLETYHTRLRLLHVDTSQFVSDDHVPELTLSCPDPANRVVHLHLVGHGGRYPLTRVNIWINDDPLFTSAGLPLAEKNSLDTIIEVKLGTGKNVVEAAVRNSNGLQSYRSPIVMDYLPKTPEPWKIYFVGIGASEFKEAAIHDLPWVKKDVTDLNAIFKDRYKDTLIPKNIFDKEICTDSINSLHEWLQHTEVDDIVVVFYSGHGLISPKQHGYYLSGYNTDFNDPEVGGIPYSDIEKLLDDIPARKKLLLLDACYSGNFDQQTAGTMDSSQAKSDIASLLKAKIKSIDNYATTGGLGRQEYVMLMQDIFANISSENGVMCIAASRGNERAKEGQAWQNGAFTFALKQGLMTRQADLDGNGQITINELGEYTGKKVGELTGGLQVPTIRQELPNTSWVIWE
jgi:hypothetical protein